MKKKELLSCVLTLLFSTGAVAGPRTLNEAKEVALDFVSSTVNYPVELSDLTPVSVDASIAKAPQLYQAYYIFNVGQENGFVIVSGDDQARPILAYGDGGAVDLKNIPANVQYWLNTYKHEMEYLSEVEIDTPVLYDGGIPNPGTEVVKPLLGNLEWDQDAPFNLLCPKAGSISTLTGCAATSMSMVMKSHNYPESGVGKISYTTYSRKLPVSVTLGDAYQWDLMKPTYRKSDKDESADAVAKLMYHVGASLEMDYNTSSKGGSGASIFSQYSALIHNFYYNKNMYYLGRDYVSGGEWKDKLVAELEAGRAVLYSGISDGGGHSFVCDGYTDLDYFHFNWGWSGMYNGYYALSSLAPGTGGSGAGAGVYNDFQFMLLGVQPEETGSPYSCLYIDNAKGITFTKTTLQRTEELQASVTNLSNYTADLIGKIGLGIFQDGKFIDYVGQPQETSVVIGNYYKRKTFKGTVPETLPEGSYIVGVCSQTNGEATPTMARTLNGSIGYMNMEVTSSQIQLTTPVTDLNFEQPEPLKLVGTASLNGRVKFQITIKNNGAEYYDAFGVYIKSNTSLRPSARLTRTIKIPANKTTVINLEGLLPPEIDVTGEFIVRATYLDNGQWKLMSKDMGAIIDVKPEGVSIDDVMDDAKMAVAASEGVVRVQNALAGEYVELYTASGVLVDRVQADAEGSAAFSVAKNGIYLVRQGNQTVKIAC